jgi:hypothetical protein
MAASSTGLADTVPGERGAAPVPAGGAAAGAGADETPAGAGEPSAVRDETPAGAEGAGPDPATIPAGAGGALPELPLQDNALPDEDLSIPAGAGGALPEPPLQDNAGEDLSALGFGAFPHLHEPTAAFDRRMLNKRPLAEPESAAPAVAGADETPAGALCAHAHRQP